MVIMAIEIMKKQASAGIIPSFYPLKTGIIPNFTPPKTGIIPSFWIKQLT